ncbi:MAG: flippase-like domain-containing protein [Candidatus Omnitrophica bacterium]|nr:flippase-like domain-containing protein [Candidatus Omnitrophota bacterium]
MRDKYNRIVSVLKGASIPILVLALAALALALVTASVRLRLIIEAQNISATFAEAFSLTLLGYFFNNFLPTAIGGDIVKAYYLSKHSSNSTGSYTSVFVDRAIGLITMIFMAFVALFFVKQAIVDNKVRYAIYIITAASALGIFFMASKSFAKRFSVLLTLMKPIEDKLVKVYDAINIYRHHRILMLKTIAISVASQIFYFTFFGLLALSIGSRISTIDVLLRMPVVGMMSLLPSINGLGVREGATVVLFGPIIGNANAFAVSILVIVCMLITSVVGGFIYAFSPQFRIKLQEIKKIDQGSLL